MLKPVMVVRANESLDKDAIDQMLVKGFAPGFKASEARVNREIQHIIITNTENNRAVLAQVKKAVVHESTKQTEPNSDGRIDVYFTNPKEVDPKTLYENVQFNNSNPVRYIGEYWK